MTGKLDKEALMEQLNMLDELENYEEVEKMEEKRRAIRSKQSTLADQIIKNKDDLLDIHSDAWDKLREANNETMGQILYTREALGDVRVLASLGRSLHDKALRLDDSSKRINFKDFIVRIKDLFTGHREDHDDDDDEDMELHEDDEGGAGRRRRGGRAVRSAESGEVFDWSRLGADAGQLFTTTFPASIMLGPLGKPPKIRLQREVKPRAKEDKTKKMVVEDVDQDDDDDDGNKKEFNEATFARIDIQERILGKYKEQNKKIDLVSFLVDPEDQVQTIENFFDYAFLIKEKATMEAIDKITGIPTINPAAKEKLEEKESKQLVLSLNMKELQQLAQLVRDGEFVDEDEDENENENENEDNASSPVRRNNSSSSSSKKRKVWSQLHREDQLYSTANVHAQAELLLELEQEAKKKAAERKKARKESEKEEKMREKEAKKAMKATA